MKMQIAFRRLIGQKFANFDVVASVGLVDLPASHQRLNECTADFNLPISRDGREPEMATYFGNPKHLEHATDWGTLMRLRASNLEDAIKAPIRRTTPSELSNTHVLFRETAVRSQYHQGRVYAFVGTVCVANSQMLDCRDILEFSGDFNDDGVSILKLDGRLGRTLRLHFGETDLENATQGRALSSLLEQPIWGFGYEPIALGSTMDLDKQAYYETYTDLFFEEKENEIDERRYLTYRNLVAADGMTLLEDDPVLARMLWRVRQENDYIPPFHPKTRREFHSANKAMHDAFAIIERGDDDEYFNEWRRQLDEKEASGNNPAP
ncbi:hypothetical protein G6L37_01475 [Agrobacterium rubi]|nr:hypothetical protein [Agrobacterium rubi]NTF24063.1 hypothetical protein [Agrobacterium rubi]